MKGQVKKIIFLSIIFLFFSCIHDTEASNRYWVGGGSMDSWGATFPTNWSTTSGGANNASVPTGSDDVFFDANSGSGMVNLSPNINARSIDFTGFTGILHHGGHPLTFNSINSDFNVKFSPNMDYRFGPSDDINFYSSACATSCTISLTTAGKAMPKILLNATSNVTLSLQDEITSSLGIEVRNGSIITNNYNISSVYAEFLNYDNPINLNLGSSTWTITGADFQSQGAGFAWLFSNDNGTLTINPGTSTIKFTDTNPMDKTFYSDNAFYNLWFSGAGNLLIRTGGSMLNSFNNFRVDNDRPHDVFFDYNGTTSVNSFTVSGTSSNTINLNSNDPSILTPFNLSKSSGVVNVDYLNISHSNATGGATWYAGANSIDGGGNTGWIFAPTLSIQPATVGTTTATLNGTITATGGENASTRGFQYGPDTSYGTTTTESGSFSTGAYTSDITGLTCNTTYHVRSYATNGSGTHYSSDTTFTTSACPIVQQGRPATPVIIPIPTPVLPATTTPTTPVVEKPVQETVIDTINKKVEEITAVKEIKPKEEKKKVVVVIKEEPKPVEQTIETPVVTTEPIPSISETNLQVPVVNIVNNSNINFFSILSLSINQSIFDTKVAIDKTNEKIKTVLESKEGTVVSRAVTTTGIVAGATISITGALFLNPISFSEIFFIPMRLWALLMSALGLKKRNKPWGVVYDSVTKQPIDPAYVVLQDLEGNVITNSITDLDGRYGFLVSKGTYKIIANKTNYYFPSKKLSGHFSDSLYSDLYWGDYFKIENDGEVISKNIPIDPVNFDWNEFAKRDKGLMKFYSLKDVLISRISDVLFWTGFSVISLATLTAPRTYNIATFLVYVVIFILKHTVLKSQSHGVLREKSTGLPLSFAIIRVCSAKTDVEIAHKVADKLGKYYCLVPNGTYYVKIEKKNLDESYTLIYKSDPMEVREGVVRGDFEV